MNNPTITLSGAAGFLGSHLLEALLKHQASFDAYDKWIEFYLNKFFGKS